jgi:hypothetical protein
MLSRLMTTQLMPLWPIEEMLSAPAPVPELIEIMLPVSGRPVIG